MVSWLLVAGAIVLILIVFALVKKLFKLAVIVGVVALGIYLGLKLLEWVG